MTATYQYDAFGAVKTGTADSDWRFGNVFRGG